MDDKDLSRLLPPKEFFESQEQLDELMTYGKGGQMITPTYRVEWPEEGGTLSYMVGEKFPMRGWVFREAVFANDLVKRKLINDVRFVFSSSLKYYLPLIFLFSNSKKLILNYCEKLINYAESTYQHFGRMMPYENEEGKAVTMLTVCPDPKRYCNMVREIRRAALLISKDDTIGFGIIKIISMILEFDDAYRYRIQDMMSLVNKDDMIRNPGKEMKRVMLIAADRGQGTAEKFRSFAKAVPWLFRIRFIKHIIQEFFKEVSLEKLTLDTFDFYRVLPWGGYDWGGIPSAERMSLRMMIDSDWIHGESEKVKQKNKPNAESKTNQNS